jgi:nitrogen-specific signal transduction histidine kinase
MDPSAILQEAERLHNVSDRLNLLSDEHPLVSEQLMVISGSVRTMATSLELLVVVKTLPLTGPDSAND